MKKVLFVLILALFICANSFAANLFSRDILKQEALKVLPENVTLLASSEEESSAFLSYVDEHTNYQFVLLTDTQPQKEAEAIVTIGERECEFFRPLGQATGGIFIPLKNDKGSLVIILSYGFFTDETVELSVIKEIADKIDITLFD